MQTVVCMIVYAFISQQTKIINYLKQFTIITVQVQFTQMVYKATSNMCVCILHILQSPT